MGKIAEYHQKKKGFENLDSVTPYEDTGVINAGLNMPEYSLKLESHGVSPQSSWLYQAICKHWQEIRATMKLIAANDVNKSKGEAAKEAGDFLGLVNVNENRCE